MTAVPIPPRVDVSDSYWRCETVKTEAVVPMNGGRLYLDHVSKVLRARFLLDLAADASMPIKLVRGTGRGGAA